MYLGQESWGGKGGVPRPPRPVMAQPRPAGGVGGAGAEVGQSARFSIVGCKHDVVGPIVRGDYVMSGSNHNKPAYKKTTTAANGLNVLIYFWDERDGPANSGWWIAPQIGGNMVWGHHANRSSATPPTSGWQAPHSGPPDPTMVLTVPGGATPPVRPGAGGMAAPGGYAGKGMGGGTPTPPPRPVGAHASMQQQQQQRQQQAAMQKQQMEARLADQKRQHEEYKQKQAAEMKRQQEEQRAHMAIRKVVQKLRGVTPETFDALKEELAQTLAKEFDKCGAQKAKLQEESDQALDVASKKVEDAKEKRAKAEQARKEAERKRQEALDKATNLLTELISLTDAAEEAVKALTTSINGFAEKSGLETEDKVKTAAAPVEKLNVAASEKVAECSEFLKVHTQELRVLPVAPVAKPGVKSDDTKAEEKAEGEEEEAKPTLQTMQKTQLRVASVRGSFDLERRRFETVLQDLVKKSAAKQALSGIQSVFDKYDKDKDGLLNKKEMAAFAKGEFKYTLADDELERILKVLAADGKGVTKGDFQRVKVAVGVSREREKDRARRAEREALEQEIADQKAKAQTKFDGVTASMKACEEEANEANKQSRNLQADCKGLTSVEMLKKATEVEKFVSAFAGKVAALTKSIASIEAGEDLQDSLKGWFAGEKKKLQTTAHILEGQATRVAAQVEKVKSGASKRDAEEVKELAAKVVLALKAHQTAQSLTADALFEAIAEKGADSFGEDELVAFVGKMPKAEGQAEALTDENVRRAFAAIDEEKVGGVSKSTFDAVLTVLMKVVKDVAFTDGVNIKDAKSLRRLEIGEVVQVLEGPVKEELSGVDRVRGKAMSDGTEGWVTISGNQGSVFLKEGVEFKVVKDTILTESFDIEASKEDTRKIKESTRKLKPGELLELREWARKHEGTGLTRMKCKVKSDGAVGYVTTVGNTGIKFVEVV